MSSMSQILTAAGNASSDALVLGNTLYSSCNMLGRLTCMVPSNFLVRHGIPRLSYMLVVIAEMAVAHFLLLLLPYHGGSMQLVAASTIIGGLAFGSAYPHMVVLTSELFGSANLATNYMFYDGCSFIGTLILVRIVAAKVEQSHTRVGKVDCIGAECFNLTHTVVIAVNIVAMVGMIVIVARSRTLYRNISNAIQAVRVPPCNTRLLG